ncbi:hypothetical protein Angca_001389, partial [Angiostrongylus cantonensis]
MAIFIPMNYIATPTIVFSYIQIAACFGFPIFSLLSWSGLGWNSVHYGGCIVTTVLFGVFMLIHYDDEFKEKATREGTFNTPCIDLQVLSIPIVGTGLLLAIPPVSNIVVSFLMYGIFSKLANAEVTKLRLFNTLGTVPSGIFFTLIGSFDPEHQRGSATHHIFLLANLFLINCVSMFLTSLFNVLIANNDEYC